MKTEDLIASLGNDCAPVQVLPSISRRIALYSCLGVAWALITLCLLGARNLSTVHHPYYWIGEIAILVSLAILSISAAIRLSIPGEERKRPWRKSVAVLGLWLLYLVAGTALLNDDYGTFALHPVNGAVCAVSVSLLCIIPVVLMLRAVRAGYVTSPRWAAFCAVAAGAVLSVLGIELHCVYESTIHHVAYHFVPVVLFSTLGWIGSRKLVG